ncbi:anthranilate synthase component II [Legionella dresdenensis]|uniref:Anthranilate synthase component II n=1 Tax=Legionella dresdenensis TaxID=450200 RepID=A0ABV8CC72_9GAMM
MLLMIDNHDSFTYNLVQYFQQLNQNVAVYTNNAITLEDIEHLAPQRIVISPGPNSPDEAGISLPVIERFYQRLPILGICLGHQCIGQFFGAAINRTNEIFHGKTSLISHNNEGLFRTLPAQFNVMRYHSLAIAGDTLPACIRIDAWAGEVIMAIAHRDYPVFGLQFHPESILSDYGIQLLARFINDEY